MTETEQLKLIAAQTRTALDQLDLVLEQIGEEPHHGSLTQEVHSSILPLAGVRDTLNEITGKLTFDLVEPPPGDS